MNNQPVTTKLPLVLYQYQNSNMTLRSQNYPIALVALSSFFFLLFAPLASAYTISPMVIDIDVTKRDLMTRDITISNVGGGPARIYPTVNEISVDENGEIKAFEQAVTVDRTDTVTSWLEISRGRITLAPDETKVVPLTIRINPNAKAGEYHAFIGFPSAADKTEANQKSMAGNAPGTIVRFSIGKDRTEFLKLNRFSIDRFVTDLAKPVLAYDITNSGQSELVPRGEVIFYDTRGNEVGAVPINPEASQIEPSDLKAFTSALPEDLKAGKYKAFMSLEYGTEQLASLTDTTFFYVMPLSTMLMIFGGVLIFALLLTVFIYRRMSIPVHHDGTEDVFFYYREGTSEAKDHDIDLKNPKNE